MVELQTLLLAFSHPRVRFLPTTVPLHVCNTHQDKKKIYKQHLVKLAFMKFVGHRGRFRQTLLKLQIEACIHGVRGT
jgi:hypothetical protein